MPQNIFLTDDTIAANIAFGQEPKDIHDEEIQKVSKIANLHDFIQDELPNQYQTKIGERGVRLSGGQRQRAAIGKALASEADLILMDEPMVGVDRESRNSIMRLLDDLCHEQNKTIVMISHDLASIKQTVHRMIYLEETIRYDGPTSEFPELSSLAKLRGIVATHDSQEQIAWNEDEQESGIIIMVPGKEGEK